MKQKFDPEHGMSQKKMKISRELVLQVADAIGQLGTDAAGQPLIALERALREQLSVASAYLADERAKFEREAQSQGQSDFARNPDGAYMNFYMECAWMGWQQKSQEIEFSCRDVNQTQVGLLEEVVEYDAKQRVGEAFNLSGLINRINVHLTALPEFDKKAAQAEQVFFEDIFSHHDSWRKAIVLARDHAPARTEDTDERAYWQHQLDAFDRTYALIA
jgi:hypothetical protein